MFLEQFFGQITTNFDPITDFVNLTDSAFSRQFIIVKGWASDIVNDLSALPMVPDIILFEPEEPLYIGLPSDNFTLNSALILLVLKELLCNADLHILLRGW